MVAIVSSELAINGTIYAKFADIHDADKVFSTIQHGDVPWSVKHIAPKYFALKHHPESLRLAPVSMYEGQVLVVVSQSTMPQRLDVGNLGSLVKEVLEHCGELMTFSFDRAEACKAVFRAEYCNINCADNALLYVEGVKLAVKMDPEYGYLQLADIPRYAP